MNNLKKIQATSFFLHLIAMICMLCDHLWAVLLTSHEWLTCIGRIAFPIFAFCISEGLKKTSNKKKYIIRLTIFALISEIPFNLMYASQIFYPYHQNVLWTFLIAILMIILINKTNFFPFKVFILLLSYILGYVLMTDYYGIGVIMVMLFYFIPSEGWKFKILQLGAMYFLNVSLLGGYYYELNIFGYNLEIVQQSIAILSLIPIWLYKGKQGHHSKIWQYFCYTFYPLHMLGLFVIKNLIL